MNKIMRGICIAGSIVTLFCSGPSWAHGNETTETERIAVYNEWISAAHHVAGNDGFAKHVLSYVVDNAALIIPVHVEAETSYLGFKLLELRSDMSTTVVPLLEGDEGISDSWNNFLQNKKERALWASQDKDDFIIFIGSNVPVTDAWKGLIFLHECYRAWSHKVQKTKSGNIAENSTLNRAIDELFAYILITCPSISEIGGVSYQQFLELEKAHAGKNVEKWLANFGQLHDPLQVIFGPAESQFELDLRKKTVSVHVLLEYFNDTTLTELEKYGRIIEVMLVHFPLI